MNGGLLGLRNTTWFHDFSALWWFTRCGHKDQRGLWLVLFATWSAMTASDHTLMAQGTSFESRQFAYPGFIFLTYDFGFTAALSHLRKTFLRIQITWRLIKLSLQDKSTQHESSDGGNESKSHALEIPTPTNTSWFDGGEWIERFKRPLELPHVLLLPLTSHTHRKANGKTVDLPGLKADVVNSDRQSFVIHSKTFQNVCTKNKCWPFVVEDKK